jgi:hypothetical protein
MCFFLINRLAEFDFDAVHVWAASVITAIVCVLDIRKVFLQHVLEIAPVAGIAVAHLEFDGGVSVVIVPNRYWIDDCAASAYPMVVVDVFVFPAFDEFDYSVLNSFLFISHIKNFYMRATLPCITLIRECTPTE